MPWLKPKYEPHEGQWVALILVALPLLGVAAEAFGQKDLASWLALGWLAAAVLIIGCRAGEMLSEHPER